MASDIILYQYPFSPFGEKIRLMLGYAGLPWQSVQVREMPPRPELDFLTGGYRRIPVMQIGADLYCDTCLISQKISAMANKPELNPHTSADEVRELATRADGEMFMACIVSASGKKLLKRLFKEFSIIDVGKFLWDRINMSRKSSLPQLDAAQARAKVNRYLDELEQRLADSPFLFGEQPSYADFSVYHGLWFIREVAQLEYINRYTRLIPWMDRMKAFGHGTVSIIAGEEAHSQAAHAIPDALPKGFKHSLKNRPVTIAPSDYGKDPVTGVLAGGTEETWIIQRSANQHTVHVHFPQSGYDLKPI